MKTQKALKPVLRGEQLIHAADCLRILAHAQRLDLVQRLLENRYSVGELAEVCGLSPAITSGHLRLMQRCGLLSLYRESRNVYYSIAEPCLRDLMDCLAHRFQNR